MRQDDCKFKASLKAQRKEGVKRQEKGRMGKGKGRLAPGHKSERVSPALYQLQCTREQTSPCLGSTLELTLLLGSQVSQP